MKWTDPALVAALEAEGTTVCRIASSKDWWAERFGDGVIVSHAGETLPPDVLPPIEAWLKTAGLGSPPIFARRLVVGPGESDRPVLVRGGEKTNSKATVTEAGLRYEVDFVAGYSCGLFLDQRANRARLRALGAVKVLNTFAYTCSFSVAAAAGGSQTLSLDLAKGSLEKGKRNFQLNDLSTEGHRFIADDVLQVLPRLGRRREKFDAIILDPPTFSRAGRGRPFQVERDYSTLLKMALECASERAAILLSTNCSTLPVSGLRAVAEWLVPGARFHAVPALPDIPATEAASTLWMELP